MSLLASSAGTGWILDIVFFVLMLGGLLFGAVRGFVRSICKLGGTILSVFMAISFCTPLQAALEKAFGLTTLIANGIHNATVAGWIGIAICFILLLVLTKLAAWLFGKVAKALIDRSKALAIVDRVLGALIGLAEAFLLCFFLLTVLNWLNIAAVNEFIQTSFVVKGIYSSNWFLNATKLPGRIVQNIG